MGSSGKYGVQNDRVDKCAVGWEHKEELTKHESQKDYKTGFGGKFGVQKDRVDKSAVKSYEETGEKIGTNYEKTRPDVPSKNASNLRARFENIAQQNEIEAQKRAEDEKRKREEKDKKDKLENKKREEQRMAQEKEEQAKEEDT